MSAGAFTSSKYQADAGNGGGIYRCKIQPETLAASINNTANDPPAGAVDQNVSAAASKTKREYGVGMRSVLLTWTATIPDGYSGDPVRIPVLTPAVFAQWGLGQTGTYLGQAVRVDGRSAEDLR